MADDSGRAPRGLLQPESNLLGIRRTDVCRTGELQPCMFFRQCSIGTEVVSAAKDAWGADSSLLADGNELVTACG